MSKYRLSKLAALVVVATLSACTSKTFQTMYETSLDAQMTKKWRVARVDVDVPRSLSVSEAAVLVPKADIVWREEAFGDRYEQVSRIVAAGVKEGSRSLIGARPVVLRVTISRFHAMTLEAEALRYDVGVHNIDFTASISDKVTGAVLVPPTFIRAEFPAMTGPRMVQARVRGESQQTQIEAHIARVIAGWLGVGPDPRATFTRIGG